MLDSIAPFETAEEWDKLMVGDSGSAVRSILVALDPSIEVIKAAKGTDIDLILTHHPLMLHPIRYLDLREGVSKKIALLIESRINLVSMHTNLDNAPGGVADELASSLGLKDVRPFGALRIGTIGTHKPLDGWLKSLPIRNAHIIDAGRDVCMVGACPGSGMECWYQAWQMGCDTFVTGDVRYHAIPCSLRCPGCRTQCCGSRPFQHRGDHHKAPGRKAETKTERIECARPYYERHLFILSSVRRRKG